jgi:polypeptide N-acetylgalactosaminyltransferase
MTKIGEIRRDDACLDFNKDDVKLYGCHGGRGNQEWRWEPIGDVEEDGGAKGRLRHGPTGQCLAVATPIRDRLVMIPCRPDALEQTWRFSTFNKTAADALQLGKG